MFRTAEGDVQFYMIVVGVAVGPLSR